MRAESSSEPLRLVGESAPLRADASGGACLRMYTFQVARAGTLQTESAAFPCARLCPFVVTVLLGAHRVRCALQCCARARVRGSSAQAISAMGAATPGEDMAASGAGRIASISRQIAPALSFVRGDVQGQRQGAGSVCSARGVPKHTSAELAARRGFLQASSVMAASACAQRVTFWLLGATPRWQREPG